jgi:prophage DNA circulation protein
MAWQDRLNEAAYTPPNGPRLVLKYEEVRTATELRGSRFQFANVEGTYVQGTGSSGREFPMRIYFNGEDHDTQAAAFLRALRDTGEGTLEHPIAGRVQVVPLGRIVQRNNLATAANESAFEVTFWETIGALYPSSQSDPASDVLAAVSGFNTAVATAYEGDISLETGSELAELTNEIKARTEQVKKFLTPIAATVESVSNQFDDIADSITGGINVLVGTPLTLAFQIVQLAQAPARAFALWQDKIEAYANLAANITTAGARTPTVDRTAQNLFLTDDLYASGALTGVIVGAINNEFTTQPDAIEAAQAILAQAGTLNTWREQNFEALGETDTGESYQQWQEAASLCAGFLVQISFTLAQERIITTERDRSIVDLCAELYGSVDDKLDFFINSNSLTGDEIIEIPRGRSIKYYV